MRVLIVEPQPLTQNAMGLFLRIDGCAVQVAETADDAADMAPLYEFDAILLSLDHHDHSSVQGLRRLRARTKAPIIALSASAGVEVEVDALAAGADDFIRKPFHKAVMVGRLNALVRRTRGHAQPVIEVGPLRIDTVGKDVKVDGKAIHLTGREYQVLECMALRLGHVFTKEALLDQLYGGRDEPEIKIIDVFICKIRNKLRAHDAAQYVETVWGRGYRVVLAPTEHVWQPPNHVPPVGYGARMLERLSAGPATFPQLWGLFPVAPESSIRAALTTLVQRGEVINAGEPRAAVYRLREPKQAAA
jgi:two-component system cell cycle response regulator CtrA